MSYTTRCSTLKLPTFASVIDPTLGTVSDSRKFTISEPTKLVDYCRVDNNDDDDEIPINDYDDNTLD